MLDICSARFKTLHDEVENPIRDIILVLFLINKHSVNFKTRASVYQDYFVPCHVV